MKLIYIGGPFSAPTREGVEANIARAVELAIEVALLGAVPICPHSNTAHPDFERVQPYTFWIDATKALLRKCDALILVPCWEGSAGTRGEVELAYELGLPVFNEPRELAAWLDVHHEAEAYRESKEDRP